MLQARRSLAVILSAAGASMSAGAGYMYLGDDASHHKQQPLPLPTNANIQQQQTTNDSSMNGSTTTNSVGANTNANTSNRRRPLRAISKKELGWEQSLARDLACWISSASVYTATQVFYAAAPSSTELLKRLNSSTNVEKREPHSHQKLLANGSVTAATADSPSSSTTTTAGLYHNLVGWIQELNPQANDWNANEVIQSASFSMLLNVVSGIDNLRLREDLEQEMYRAVNLLATNPQCANAIVQRATRYGKHALLNMAQTHELDPRMGDALSAMVAVNKTNKHSHFGPANLMSLVALAVADDVPDSYLQFALWALSKAASRESSTSSYEWRKTLFGVDSTSKTRRKLVANARLWETLGKIRSRPILVQEQAAQLIRELSEEDPQLIVAKLKKNLGTVEAVVHWINADNPALACAALQTISNIACDRGLKHHLLSLDALELIRARVLRHDGKKNDPTLTAHLLRAVRSLAQQQPQQQQSTSNAKSKDAYLLDRDSLSFMHATDDEEHPLHHDDFVLPKTVLTSQYVDGWIELFTTFLRSDKDDVRTEAALCLEQMATMGTHQDQGIQEWLIAVLDGVLQQVPASIAAGSTSVRAAKSRTRPIVGRRADSDGYASSHAKALRALAHVAGRKECQQELARRGGVPLLKRLLASGNTNVQRETARVLANLFTCDEMDPEIAEFASTDEQLTKVLDQWTRSSDTMLQSLAHRARSNRRYQHNRLHHADESDVKYLDGVHPLHFSTSPAFNNGNSNSPSQTTSAPTQNSENESTNEYDVDVVFIHGLLGCPYETWICGEDDSNTLWAQEWLLDDLKKDGHNPRILSIGYDSQLLASESTWRTMCFQETSQDVLTKLQAARVGESGRPVVFVTHSLGGVVLKQVLLESESQANAQQQQAQALAQATTTTNNDSDMESDIVPAPRLVDSVHGVVFYGVPHHGSPIAQTIQSFRPKTLGIEQHPVTEHLHGTPHLKMLNDWCTTLFHEKSIAAMSIGETVPCRLPLIGVDALVVPPASANPGFGEFVCVENATHVDVCKPRSKQDLRYTLAREFISKQVPPPNGSGENDDEDLSLSVE